MQEVIGGEQHQGAHFPLVLLEGAAQQALGLGGEPLTGLVVEHCGLRGLGRRAGAPLQQGQTLVGEQGVVVLVPIEIELAELGPAVEIGGVGLQALVQGAERLVLQIPRAQSCQRIGAGLIGLPRLVAAAGGINASHNA
ncbi:hypothetical protein D3C84_733900 [compost metagenome]